MLSDSEEWCYGVADLTLMSHDRTTVMQMIRKSVRDAEEACAQVCDARARKCAVKADDTDCDEDDRLNLRSLAWQFTVLADEMRKRLTGNGRHLELVYTPPNTETVMVSD